jgi:ABC-type phosphate transport system substrate-binding protein
MTRRPRRKSPQPAADACRQAAPERTPPGLVYTLFSLCIALVLPGLAAVATYASSGLARVFNLDAPAFVHLFLVAPVPFCLGYVLARLAPLPETLFRRFAPMLTPLWLLFAAAGPLIWWMPGEARLLTRALAALTLMYGLYVLGFAWKSERRQAAALRTRGLVWLCALFFLAGAGMEVGWGMASNNTLYDDPPSPAEDTISMMATPATPPTLHITANHPRLDGSAALLPVYAAVAQAVYADPPAEQENASPLSLPELVRCSDTPSAYQALIDGRVDLFFGLPPSVKQLEAIRRQGLNPAIRPIGREALVFFVHQDNPVVNLSQDQIRAVYSRRVLNWNEIGGDDAAIVPFQRPEGSDSQAAMQQLVMRGQAMAHPLRHEFRSTTGELVNTVADYRNRPDALGYSFLRQTAELFASEAVRLLSVDGVLPTLEAVYDGDYPYIVPLVVVSCRPLSRESKELLDWITSAEGQSLITRTGYVPLPLQ